jgi:hypothetical protein
MNILQIINTFGEINSMQVNLIPVDDMGGDAELILDLMGSGTAFAPLILRNFPKFRPRVCVPAETPNVKVEC